MNTNIKYLVRLGVVLQVHAWDYPAVRGSLAAPERLIKALSLGALQNFQASGANDLVNEPQAAPLTVLQSRADQGTCDVVLWRGILTPVFVFVGQGFHCNKLACKRKNTFAIIPPSASNQKKGFSFYILWRGGAVRGQKIWSKCTSIWDLSDFFFFFLSLKSLKCGLICA